MSLSSNGRLTCKIYPSVSTITYPIIIVTGYDRIRRTTDVVIRILGLKTLSAGVEDYIKIGVSLIYFDYGGVQGYLYEPTGKVVGPTTAAAIGGTYTFQVTETGDSFVGSMSNYSFAGTLGGSYNPVTTSDYVSIEFPTNFFEGNFSMNTDLKIGYLEFLF